MADLFEERTRRLQQQLAAAGADAAVFFPSPNLYYLTGFWEEPMERPLLLIVPETGEPAFVAPDLYEVQLREETWVARIETYADGEDPLDSLAAIRSDLGLSGGTLLLDPTMWARFTLAVREVFADSDFALAEEVMGRLRQRKDRAELDRLETASNAADEVMTAVRTLGEDAIGMTESELADWIRDALLGRGEALSFDVVVGSGPNGAKPHHRHGGRTIQPGDPVVLDFGVRVDHYPSDTTRTVVFEGDPPESFEAVHEVVRKAQEAGVEVVEPGIPAERVDETARSVIEEAGYGDEFVHRTGHGVGLDVHEDPYIVSGNRQELEPGMVFSVEPGIYLEGAFGVRIEDLVVVTESGARRLNRSSRDWEC